ncbi:hypothetical protein, partial [Neisseria gonorrhoeae]|uniref:hypothetical protein n=1 Tax=Neisseria gonorrhoeae TaxID=485 RepID=UPI0021BF0A69
YVVAPPRLKGNGSLRRPSTGRIGSVPFVPSAARRLVLIFVNPPYCVETPPGTRYNPPFNISENLFLTGQTE